MERNIIDIVSDEALLNFVKQGLKVVDFSASWCKPCSAVAPRFEQLAGRFKGKDVQFAKVDIGVLVGDWGIQSVPTFKVYKDGSVLNVFYGTVLTELEALLNSIRISSK